MSAPVTKPAFAHLLPADKYTAWRILPDGTSQPLDLLGRSNLADAAEAALQGCQHKEHFIVLQITPTKRIEHVYYVKAGKPTWRTPPGMVHAVQVKPLLPELRFSRQVAEIAPVEPWRWAPGCDVVGNDRDVVEQSA